MIVPKLEGLATGTQTNTKMIKNANVDIDSPVAQYVYEHDW